MSIFTPPAAAKATRTTWQRRKFELHHEYRSGPPTGHRNSVKAWACPHVSWPHYSHGRCQRCAGRFANMKRLRDDPVFYAEQVAGHIEHLEQIANEQANETWWFTWPHASDTLTLVMAAPYVGDEPEIRKCSMFCDCHRRDLDLVIPWTRGRGGRSRSKEANW